MQDVVASVISLFPFFGATKIHLLSFQSFTQKCFLTVFVPFVFKSIKNLKNMTIKQYFLQKFFSKIKVAILFFGTSSYNLPVK